MNEKEFLYWLLHHTLIQIRAEAYEIKNKKLFWISNLIHNLPLSLLNASTKEDFDKLLSDFDIAAEHQNMKEWLEQTKKEYISMSSTFKKEDGKEINDID